MWPPRDWRAFIALAASIGGAAILTAVLTWQAWVLWRGGWSPGTERQRLYYLGTAHLLTIVGVLLVLFGLGWAINRRSLKASIGGNTIEASGGEEQ